MRTEKIEIKMAPVGYVSVTARRAPGSEAGTLEISGLGSFDVRYKEFLTGAKIIEAHHQETQTLIAEAYKWTFFAEWCATDPEADTDFWHPHPYGALAIAIVHVHIGKNQ